MSFLKKKSPIMTAEDIRWIHREREAADLLAQHLEDREWLKHVAKSEAWHLRYGAVDLGRKALAIEIITADTVNLTADGVDITMPQQDIEPIYNALVVASLASTHTTFVIHPADAERESHTIIYKSNNPMYRFGERGRRALTTEEAAIGMQKMHAASRALGERLCARAVQVG